MKSATCFSTGKVCAACLVVVTILTATNFYKLWVCHAPAAANATEPVPEPPQEVDPTQQLDRKMDQQTQLLLEIHQDMDEVNSNLNEIQVILKDE